MINFKITDIQGGMLTIERPAGQAISLKLAEIVRAQVMEILPSGAIALKVKGESLIAKTQVPLQPGSAPFFKVTGLPVEGKDLQLQFIGFSRDEETPQDTPQPFLTEGKKAQIASLLKEFDSILQQFKGSRSELPSRTARLQDLNTEILKSLPSDIQRLPKELRAQLQDLLQTSLKLTGQGIQSKISELIKSLPPEMPQARLIENLKGDLSVSIDRLLNTSLKGALQDTGVALEAKLKNMAKSPMPDTSQDPQRLIKTAANVDAEGILTPLNQRTALKPNMTLTENVLPDMELPDTMELSDTLKSDSSRFNNIKLGDAKAEIQDPDNARQGLAQQQKNVPTGQKTADDSPMLHNDLKAKLLQLKQTISSGREALSSYAENMDLPKAEAAVVSSRIASADTSINRIDSLLKDIETFQTLSKATDSFYTFLPVDWKELKEGDIAFKKGKSKGGGSAYSCRVNLDLHELGSVGIIVMKYGNDFFVSLRAQEKGFQSALIEGLGELKESFLQRGMSLKSVNVFDYKDYFGFEKIEELASDKGSLNITA